jgi:hypothetical protein
MQTTSVQNANRAPAADRISDLDSGLGLRVKDESLMLGQTSESSNYYRVPGKVYLMC